MANNPDNDNDRQTALQIANSQASATTEVSLVRAATEYGVTAVEIDQINAMAAIRVMARGAAAGITADEVYENASIDAYVRYANGQTQVYEIGRNNAIAVGLIAATAAIDTQAIGDESAAQIAVIYGESQDRVRADREGAAIRVAEDTAIAAIDAATTTRVAAANIQQVLGEEAAPESESLGVAAAQIRTIAALAAIDADTLLYGVNVESTADRTIADLRHDTSIEIAMLRADADLYVAGLQSQGSKLEADSHSRLTISGADQDRTAAEIAAEARSDASHHDADNHYLEALAREDGEDERLGIALSYADAKFNQIYPLIAGGVTIPGEPTTPGLMTPWPATPVRGVYTPRMVQMRVNRVYAEADTAFAVGFRSREADATGRGFSAASPYLDVSRAVLASSAVRCAAAAAVRSRVEAVRANADRLTSGQVARGHTVAARNRVALASEANAIERQVGLLDGVAAMIAGIASV